MTAAAARSARRTGIRSFGASLWRKPTNRYALLGLASVAIVIVAMTQVASVVVDHWAQRDVELRSGLVFRSIRTSVIAGLTTKPATDLTPYFEGLAEDERLLALGYCDPGGRLRYATKEDARDGEMPV